MNLQTWANEFAFNAAGSSSELIREALFNDLLNNMTKVCVEKDNTVIVTARTYCLIQNEEDSILGSLAIFDCFTPDIESVVMNEMGLTIPFRFKGRKRFKFWFNQNSVKLLMDKVQQRTDLYIPCSQIFSD